MKTAAPGTRALLAVAGMIVLPGCAPDPPSTGIDPYLEAATAAGYWILAEANGTAAAPDRAGDTLVTPGLGSGSAGRAVFFAELFSATGELGFRDAAQREAGSALEAVAQVAGDYSLYGGLSGIAFALVEVADVLGDVTMRDEAHRLFARIASQSLSRGGAGWGGTNDVIAGVAGVGLGLLHAHDRFGDEAFLAAAVEVGDALVVVADSLPSGGLRWLRGADMPLDLPNFSHGTAGVGYFLGRLGAASGEPRFSDAAEGALRYLDTIADQRDGLFLVPYGVPNDGYVTPYDIGWAHGPPGVARIHYAAWRRTSDARMRDRVAAAARTVLASGLPGESADTSLWRGTFPIDRRFGTSGAAAFLLDWGLVSGEGAYVAAGLRIADDLVRRATPVEDGVYWSVPLYGFQSGAGDAAFTGYFYGAAGVGLTLLHAHFARSGAHPRIRFPDDPFAIRRGPGSG